MKDYLHIQNRTISFTKKDNGIYISLTDVAKQKNSQFPKDVIKNWMRLKGTIEFLILWEKINNPNFKGVEFDPFRKEAGNNYFVISPKQWTATCAIGITSKPGKNGGTFAHQDIALEFASWVSVEFKLYLIKEFERLKAKEVKQNNWTWNLTRNLAKINYDIHTDAIKKIIPPNITQKQIRNIYSSEADLLNVALFGITAKEWRLSMNKNYGDIRDNANIAQLICLSNLESINSVMIKDGLSQSKRLIKLNKIAISQMRILVRNSENIIHRNNLIKDSEKALYAI